MFFRFIAEKCFLKINYFPYLLAVHLFKMVFLRQEFRIWFWRYYNITTPLLQETLCVIIYE